MLASRSADRESLLLRRQVREADVEAIGRLVAATGYFSPAEVEIARELAEERLRRGAASGYHFFLAERGGELAGYSCFGPTPATVSSFDLYWIAVHPGEQGRGVGRRLLEATEAEVCKQGGARLWVDTSDRAQYAGTRAFYERCGFQRAAHLEEFYAPGEGKAIYVKSMRRE